LAAVSEEIVVSVAPDRLFDVLSDYASYPQFVPQVKSVRILTAHGPPLNVKEVEYQLDLGIKKITYTLRHSEERPRRLHWNLVGGELMRVLTGTWALSGEGGSTRARYSVEVEINKPPLVPKAFVDKLTEELTRVQLPKMMQAFKQRAEGSPAP
jgi:ribosome-associated toxin RatA of RatAB toxin-antitoxin module